MALENAVYLDNLEPLYPATGDQTAQGDDHLRMLKAVLKKTFPGLVGEYGRVIQKSAGFTPALTENSAHFVSTAAITCALPALSGLPEGYHIFFRAQGGAIVCTPNGTETIEGSASGTVPVSTSGALIKKSETEWSWAEGGDPLAAGFPSGTRMPFAQAAAPVGWVQDTSDNATNRMLRVVPSTGNGVGGSHSPILNDVVPGHTHALTIAEASISHTHTFTTGTESAAHTHGLTLQCNRSDITGSGGGMTHGYGAYDYHAYATGAASATHTHSGTTAAADKSHAHTGTSDSGSSNTNWTPRYIDMIICTKS